MKKEISSYRFDIVIIRETILRIMNDFKLFGISISVSGNEQTAYQELMSQLIPAMENLRVKNKNKLMQVLYRIDISEEKLIQSKSKFPQTNLSEIIAHLVIEREMQKVITRKYF